MILYLHGFDASSPGNHDKIRQLQFIDKDVRLLSYSTLHPKHDMQHLLNETSKQLQSSDDPDPMLIGVGLGGFWAERIGFLLGLKSVLINPNLQPQHNMMGKVDRPEEYMDITKKCVIDFRDKNRENSLVILSRNNEVVDNQLVSKELCDFYQIYWDEKQPHKFPALGRHLPIIQAFKNT